MGNDKKLTLEEKVYFVETQLPNYPMYLKFEMCKEDGTPEEVEQAFKKLWEKMYI